MMFIYLNWRSTLTLTNVLRIYFTITACKTSSGLSFVDLLLRVLAEAARYVSKLNRFIKVCEVKYFYQDNRHVNLYGCNRPFHSQFDESSVIAGIV